MDRWGWRDGGSNGGEGQTWSGAVSRGDSGCRGRQAGRGAVCERKGIGGGLAGIADSSSAASANHDVLARVIVASDCRMRKIWAAIPL